MIKLSPRLQCIADLVPMGSHIADIGTDHAYLPIYLLQNNIAQSAIASDINIGPLNSAKKNAAEQNIQSISFIQCDGLHGITPDVCDVVIIAGIGGDLMVRILSENPWVFFETMLILQPMTKCEVVRKFLHDQKIRITHEDLAQEGEKLYSIFVASGNMPEEYTPGEYLIGKYSQIQNHPLFPTLLNKNIQRLEYEISCKETQERQDLLKEFKALL